MLSKVTSHDKTPNRAHYHQLTHVTRLVKDAMRDLRVMISCFKVNLILALTAGLQARVLQLLTVLNWTVHHYLNVLSGSLLAEVAWLDVVSSTLLMLPSPLKD